MLGERGGREGPKKGESWLEEGKEGRSELEEERSLESSGMCFSLFLWFGGRGIDI